MWCNHQCDWHRLRDFWKFLGTKFRAKVAQIFCNIFRLLRKMALFMLIEFLATFGEGWATFYSHIWSHWSPWFMSFWKAFKACVNEPLSFHSRSLHQTLKYLESKSSVTRFGKISPLWHTMIKIWPFQKCEFSNWKNFELILYAIEQF